MATVDSLLLLKQNNNERSMSREQSRLDSFSSWSFQHPDYHILARLGFYYGQYRDVVICNFCKIALGNWEPTDDVLSEHKRWSPSCPLLLGRDTDNEPINSELLNIQLSKAQQDVCGSTNKQLNNRGDYRLVTKRIKSFENWPKFMKQNKSALVEAGFYYTGKSDIVKCFCCGVEISDWFENEDPFKKHALHTNACNYLESIQDQSFRKNTLEELPNSSKKENLNSMCDSGYSSLGDKLYMAPLQTPTEDSLLCVICQSKERNILFSPCHHIVCCAVCLPSLGSVCPVCRGNIIKTDKVFL